MKLIFLAFSLLLLPGLSFAQIELGELTGRGMPAEMARYLTDNGIGQLTEDGIEAEKLTYHDSHGQEIPVPYVVTPATNLTPAPTTNEIRYVSMVAAAAPTSAAVALPANPKDGTRRIFFNTGANPVVVAALGTPGMNFPVTPGPRRIVVPARGGVDCRYWAAGLSWGCSLISALPTPFN